MRLKITLLTFFCVVIISCRQTEKSKEIIKEALDVYLSSELGDSRIEKSLELTNRALELDDHNISALTHKTTLLFRKKDIDGLLQISDNLIKLRPEKPYYLAQKALYLELNGDTSSANEYYSNALSKYQKQLKSDSLDFNFLLEYVGLLEFIGDTTLATQVLTRMDSIDFNDSQKQILGMYRAKVYRSQSFSKDKLKKYWSGEISYEQIEKNKNF